MRSKGVVQQTEHVSEKLGGGSSQPQQHLDNGAEALLESFRETSSSGSAIPNEFWYHR